MFEFIIALLGGTFYSSVFINGKRKDKAYERRLSASIDQHECLRNEVVSEELESEIQEYVYRGKHVDEIYETLKDDLIAAFGENYREEANAHGFFLPGDRNYKYTSNERLSGTYFAIMLLMSMKGKVTRWEYDADYYTGRGETATWNLALYRRIQLHLIENGANLKFVFQDPGTPEGHCCARITFSHQLFNGYKPENVCFPDLSSYIQG